MSEHERPMTADAFLAQPAETQRVAPVPLTRTQKMTGADQHGREPEPPQTADVSPPPEGTPNAAASSDEPYLLQPPQQGRRESAPQAPASHGYAHPGERHEQAAGPYGQAQPLQYWPDQAVPEAEQNPPPENPYTFADFTAATAGKAPPPPAEWGWRGRVRKVTGGRISPAMGSEEAAYKAAREIVQTTFQGPRTIVFVNPKGGAGTTTSTLLAARTFGVHRGGGVMAWDNNETRGTLGQRARAAGHTNTARELLDNISMFENQATARIGDLGLYVRGQGPAFCDVLASDERPEVTGHIAAADVNRLHELFTRFYRLILIDTGNNIRAANWLKAVHSADLLVVTATVRQDTAAAALWMLDALERDVYGPGNLKSRTITLLAEPTPHCDPSLKQMMVKTFSARTRAVAQIPYDPGLVDGGVVDYGRLSPGTHTSWLFACAAMADALRTPSR